MATILVIILRVSRPNFVHFRTVNEQKPSPKGRRPPGPPIAGSARDVHGQVVKEFRRVRTRTIASQGGQQWSVVSGG